MKPKNILHVGLKQFGDNLYSFDLKNGRCKVTMLEVEADRAEHIGTFVNVKSIQLISTGKDMIQEGYATITRGTCVGKSVFRQGRVLYVEIALKSEKRMSEEEMAHEHMKLEKLSRKLDGLP